MNMMNIVTSEHKVDIFREDDESLTVEIDLVTSGIELVETLGDKRKFLSLEEGEALKLREFLNFWYKEREGL